MVSRQPGRYTCGRRNPAEPVMHTDATPESARLSAPLPQPAPRPRRSRRALHSCVSAPAALLGAGRQLWLGAATCDTSVGISPTTGQITHHIAADVDAERDKLLADLQARALVEDVFWMDDFHTRRDGRNGGGDHYHTDGRLPVVLLVRAAE